MTPTTIDDALFAARAAKAAVLRRIRTLELEDKADDRRLEDLRREIQARARAREAEGERLVAELDMLRKREDMLLLLDEPTQRVARPASSYDPVATDQRSQKSVRGKIERVVGRAADVAQVGVGKRKPGRPPKNGGPGFPPAKKGAEPVQPESEEDDDGMPPDDTDGLLNGAFR